jgi:hypothetical protein
MSDHSSDQPAATSDHAAPTTAATAPVTVEQAASILGVSVTTVRRRIRAGAIRAEEARRPQGPVWLVYLPVATTAATDQPPSATASVATVPTSSPAPAEAMVSLIQATIATVLGPLVTELADNRRALTDLAGRIAELERENGRLTERLALATPSETHGASHLTPEPPDPTPGGHRRRSCGPCRCTRASTRRRRGWCWWCS